MAEGTQIAQAYVKIIPTTKGIKNTLTSELGGAGAAAGTSAGKSFGEKMKGGVSKALKATGTAFLASTAAVGGFAASAISAGADFDSAMSDVAATMGKTMEDMKSEVGTVDLAWGTFSGNLRDYAMEMGKNTAFSATEAAEALNYMALAGYDTQESMTMLPNVLNLAAAGELDLAYASDMVTDTQTAFGISAERTTQMVDEMAKAASTGNTSVGQLGEAFLTVGGLAKELNGGMVTLEDGTTASVDGVQELEIALTAMANAGIKGSEAGTHMRNMLLKLSSPTADGAEAMEALGVSVFDATGDMRSLSDIFGDLTGAMDGLTQEEKLQAISEIFNTRDTASAEALLAAVGQDWNEIGTAILDAKGAAGEMAKTKLDNLQGDVKLFNSALERAKITLSDQLNPTLREFVQFGTDGIGQIVTGFQEGGLTGAFGALGDVLSGLVGKIVEMAPELVIAGGELLLQLVNGIAQQLPAIGTAAVEIVRGLAAAITTNLPTIMENIQAALPGLMQSVVEMLPIIVRVGQNIMDSLRTGLGEALPTILPAVAEALVAIAMQLTAPESIQSLVDSAITLMTGLANGILEAIPVLVAALPVIITNLLDGFLGALPQLVSVAGELLIGLANGLVAAIPSLVAALPDIISSLVNGLVEAIPMILQVGGELIGALIGAIIDLVPQLWQAGKDIVSGIWNGIKSMWSTFWSNISGFFSGIVDGVKNMLGIHSPSKVFADIGKNMGAGMVLGLERSAGGIQNAMAGAVDAALTEAEKLRADIPAWSITQTGTYSPAGAGGAYGVSSGGGSGGSVILKLVDGAYNLIAQGTAGAIDSISGASAILKTRGVTA